MNPIKFNYESVNYVYYKIGNGPKHVLVLHGWGSKIDSWKEFFDYTDKEKFTYYFLELPGFGGSPNPPKPWSVSDYKEFVQAFIGSQDEKIKYLLVHSFGGRIGIKLLNEPNDFEKAVFVGAAGIKPKLSFYKKFIKKIAPVLKKFMKSEFVKKLAYKLLGTNDYITAEGTLKETFLKVIDEDLTNLIPNIKIHVKLIWGKKDTYTPLYMGKKMNELIKNSSLTIINDARHGVHMQKPQKLANISEEFFNTQT